MVAINVSHNFPEVQRQIRDMALKTPSVIREALNRTTDWAATDVRREMAKVFDRPVPYTLRSLRTYYANNQNLTARLWFRQRSKDDDKLWAVPQISGGERQLKPMEKRLRSAGYLPNGWMVVPGQAAPMDAYGNMSPGEISRILNVLGSYREAGYNKANSKTVDRLRKGNKRRNQYGFVYWVNPVGGGRNKRLPPGVYRRVYTGFGTSLKPMLIFVNGAKYRAVLDFQGVVNKAVERRFQGEVNKATEKFKVTGSASGRRA